MMQKDNLGFSYFHADFDFWHNLDWSNEKVVKEFSSVDANIWLVGLFSDMNRIEIFMSQAKAINASSKNWDSDFLRSCNIEIEEPFYILFDETFKKDVYKYRIEKLENCKKRVILWCKSKFALSFVNSESHLGTMKSIGGNLKEKISEQVQPKHENNFNLSKINPAFEYSLFAIEEGALSFFDWINNSQSTESVYSQLPTKEEVNGIVDLFDVAFYPVNEELIKKYFETSSYTIGAIWAFLYESFKGRTWSYETPLQVIQAIQPAKEQRGFDLGLTDEKLKDLHKELIESKFIDPKADEKHFINAFNGEVLETGYIKLKWLKSVCGAIFLKVNFDTDSKSLKVWQNAERIFNNGNVDSLKNADKGIERHKAYEKKLFDIMKSLQ